MKLTVALAAASILSAIVAGCSGERPRPTPHVAEQGLIDAVAHALVTGARAEAGKVDAAALARASETLVLSGAHAVDASTPDLALRWAERARALGIDTPTPFRGRTLGPGYRLSHLPAGGELALDQIFMGGRKAEVAVVPVARAPFVLEVREGPERIVCRRAASDPGGRCSWIPVYTGRYSVAVRNTGSRPAEYFVVTN